MTARASCECGWTDHGPPTDVEASADGHVCGVRHGTLTAYHHHGCRCRPCRTHASRHGKRYQLARLRGPVLVDVAPAREHVANLLAAGMSFKAISLAAGWRSRNTLVQALKNTRVHRRTLHRILDVTPAADTRGDAYTDAAGTRRRLQALAAVGHTSRALAHRLGYANHTTVLDIQNGATRTVRRRAADAVARLYDDLWDVDGGSTRTRRHAQRQGWAPPLAWDDDTIGDPAAQSSIDPSEPESCPVCEDVDELLGHGEHPGTVARRLGTTPGALDVHLRRHGRLDLARPFRRAGAA